MPARRIAVLVAVAVTLLVGGASWGGAQLPPLLEPTTTTTATTATTTSPSSGSSGDGGSGSTGTGGGGGSIPAPPGAVQDGDGGTPSSGIAVPPEAQRIIDSVPRSGPSSTDGLLAALAPLDALGVARDDVMRQGMGRFPIAGPARYTHDWLFPRYGPGFRFHLGCDVFAAYGTPVRAPVDGIARSSTSTLGGLSVKVHMADGTYFYMAHLSGLVAGFTDGMPVTTGDIVGYVGDSGNARGGAPHVHFGVHPRGGAAVDPKPILDRFLAEAEARAPQLVSHYEGQQAPAPEALAPPAAPARPFLATHALRALVSPG